MILLIAPIIYVVFRLLCVVVTGGIEAGLGHKQRKNIKLQNKYYPPKYYNWAESWMVNDGNR